jgi:hypothetical protein
VLLGAWRGPCIDGGPARATIKKYRNANKPVNQYATMLGANGWGNTTNKKNRFFAAFMLAERRA